MEKRLSKFSHSFLKELYEKKYYLIAIWVTLIVTYVYFDGHLEVLPKRTFLLLGISLSALLFLKGKVYNKVFSIIMLTGTFFCFYTPVMDSPDENFHYSRALYISEGHLYLPSNKQELLVSSDISDVETVFKKPLANTDLGRKEVSSKKVQYNNLANTNGYSFVSYLPQTLGILIAKVFHLSIFASILLGRFFNLLTFALLCRFAIKKSGPRQQIFGILAIVPINIYIAASFNQDAMANGLIFLAIGIFYSFLDKKKVDYKDLLIYFCLSVLIALSKLPYVLLIGLLLFIPKEKMSQKKYLTTVLLIGIAAFYSLLWLKITSGLNLNVIHVNPIEKIKYTIENMPEFIRMMVKEGVNFIPFKLQSLFTFGWLAYDVKSFIWFYLVFISIVILISPKAPKMKKISKLGVWLVALGIIFGILMTAYLMWGEITDMSIKGIQGRYFSGVFVLLALAVNVSAQLMIQDNNLSIKEYQKEKVENFLFFVATLFIMVSLLTTIIQYYL
ncbi:DUF2142 domain-containing protein [Streptococcus anginosus]|uniref:Membrane protein, PF09913 family n=1 Tax=Streptococcus anginosus subsp. whileyi CCUG 39159 TaxID=1095729 RepID=I0SBA7_STRAP|nr:DUF2142 domain-containing protein [Streptococcus anginosus]AGU83144.1 hypothetical protein SANR_0673 [Streptococcus anginosus C238]EID20660.1 membrane protein, PF09913 family [Streptococcus anginosus subsp. whileyi CCUG 39159]MDP1384604.1 DUF2142 domain-containing protein [Streptococcus anginosus]QQT09423.1 DUF2142 domain-containing protein [Streptococcus anginosus]BAN62002.1 hypothetical protein ANG_1532 [Streptococcus anginosus subsp. whileyi MAS624]